MNNTIVPAILKDSNVRKQEATRLAHNIHATANPEILNNIARYGEFVDNRQDPPRIVIVDFYRTIAHMRDYQEMVTPLRGFDARLDEFDNTFAQTIFQLVSAEV